MAHDGLEALMRDVEASPVSQRDPRVYRSLVRECMLEDALSSLTRSTPHETLAEFARALLRSQLVAASASSGASTGGVERPFTPPADTRSHGATSTTRPQRATRQRDRSSVDSTASRCSHCNPSPAARPSSSRSHQETVQRNGRADRQHTTPQLRIPVRSQIVEDSFSIPTPPSPSPSVFVPAASEPHEGTHIGIRNDTLWTEIGRTHLQDAGWRQTLRDAAAAKCKADTRVASLLRARQGKGSPTYRPGQRESEVACDGCIRRRKLCVRLISDAGTARISVAALPREMERCRANAELGCCILPVGVDVDVDVQDRT